MLHYWTAGESHGRALVAIVDGFPAGVPIQPERIDAELRRRQGGYGRGGRQRIETDQVEVLTGIWQGTSIGSPIAPPGRQQGLQIGADAGPRASPARTRRFDRRDQAFGFHSGRLGACSALGKPRCAWPPGRWPNNCLPSSASRRSVMWSSWEASTIPPQPGTLDEQRKLRDQSEVYSLDPTRDNQIKQLIDDTRKAGDTLGGVVEVRVEGLPIGLGTHAQWDRKLDGRLAQAVMAVQAIKGVEIGLGFEAARRPGSQVHDPIRYDPSQRDGPTLGYVRPTNNAGGLEAGITNGQPLVVRAAKKPISTLAKPLESINLKTKQPESADYERSDVCAVPAASVIIESVVAFEVARALVEKFGNDSLQEMKARWELFHHLARQR